MRCCRTDFAPIADPPAAARSLPSISRHHWDQRNPTWRDTIRHCCRYLYQPPRMGPWFDVSCGNARTCHRQSRKLIFSQMSRAVACERRRVQDANKTDVSAEQRRPTEYVSTRTFCPCSHHAYTFASEKNVIFTARRYASAGNSYGRVSVVCVCHKSLFYRNSWRNRVGFWHGSFFPPIPKYVKKKFVYLQT